MKVERLSTGSEPLDELLGGGIEKSIITNIFGESGSGKTNLCIQAAASAVEDGKVVFIDTEKGFSPERFTQMASDEALEDILLAEPLDFDDQEEKIQEIEDLVEQNDVSLIVIDSMVSLYRLQANGDNVQQINQRLSSLMSELSKIARTREIPVLITNQVYTSFDENQIELVGKDVPRYWSKCLLKLSKVKNGVRKAEIEKHRSMPEGKAKNFKITNDGLKESEGNGIFD